MLLCELQRRAKTTMLQTAENPNITGNPAGTGNALRRSAPIFALATPRTKGQKGCQLATFAVSERLADSKY